MGVRYCECGVVKKIIMKKNSSAKEVNTLFVNVEHDENVVYVSDKPGIDEILLSSVSAKECAMLAESSAKQLGYRCLL